MYRRQYTLLIGVLAAVVLAGCTAFQGSDTSIRTPPVEMNPPREHAFWGTVESVASHGSSIGIVLRQRYYNGEANRSTVTISLNTTIRQCDRISSRPVPFQDLTAGTTYAGTADYVGVDMHGGCVHLLDTSTEDPTTGEPGQYVHYRINSRNSTIVAEYPEEVRLFPTTQSIDDLITEGASYGFQLAGRNDRLRRLYTNFSQYAEAFSDRHRADVGIRLETKTAGPPQSPDAPNQARAVRILPWNISTERPTDLPLTVRNRQDNPLTYQVHDLRIIDPAVLEATTPVYRDPEINAETVRNATVDTCQVSFRTGEREIDANTTTTLSVTVTCSDVPPCAENDRCRFSLYANYSFTDELGVTHTRVEPEAGQFLRIVGQ